METKTISPQKKALFYVIFFLVLPILGIIALEFAGRVIVHVKYGVPGKSYGLWQYDKELGAVHASNSYNSNSETDSLGFRNHEDVFEPKPPGALRIIAYGGSTTFCYNLDTEHAWPLRLQALLRAYHNPRDQVLNAGAVMWSISHEITRAERDLPRLHPDYVIIYSGFNEEFNAYFARLEGKDLASLLQQGKSRIFATNLDQTRWLKRNSLLVRFYDYARQRLRYRYYDARPLSTQSPTIPSASEKASYDVDPFIMKHYLIVLGQFIDLIRQNGGKPIYVITGGLRYGELGRFLQYSRNGAELARERGVPVLDSQNVVERYNGDKRELFTESAVHWSALGAQRLAEFIDANVFAAP